MGWSSLRSNVSSRKADDLISYVSGIANMEGGAILIGVEDESLEISGIDTFHDYTPGNYEIEGGEVTMRLYGKVIDIEYTRLLARNEDLSLADVMLLDRVQKGKEISLEEAKRLKAIGCLEGRRPNYHLSASIAEAIQGKADYVRTRGLNDSHYKALIIEMITKFDSVSRQEVDNLLFYNLPGVLDDKQKKIEISTLLRALRKEGVIANTGTRRKSQWTLL